MIQILGLNSDVALSIKRVIGNHVFNYEEPGHDNTMEVILNENILIKYYGFDSSVTLDLGGKKFLLENKDYWRIVLE